ncbi:MAG: diaminopimelate decarboxylase, partial [Oscillospiraceae bacterium]|nr:diaminopimelate decarboxylase [Oscillospiraceae bacterium]
ELAAKIMLSLMAKVKQELGYEIPELNLGGGFGIKYLSEDRAIEYEKYMETISKVVHSECERLNLSAPRIFLEPGRSIVGPAGITLYTVGAVKVIPNIRTYVSIDGGMSDNPRYALYKAKYSACIANKASLPFSETVTIAGKCCESGDLIGEGVPLQKTEPGDILAVFSTGAYNYSMASNYNRIPRPPVVMVKNGTARIVIKRESYKDLIKNDLL